MKYYFPYLFVIVLWASGLSNTHGQNVFFNQTLSNAAHGQPALSGFRETSMVGWQYNSNDNSDWQSASLNASVPLKNFGVYGGWLNDGTDYLRFNTLSLGINKVFESNKLKTALAIGLEGSKAKYNADALYFPDEMHDRLGFVYESPEGFFNPRRQLAYNASVALDYMGIMLFASTRARTLISTERWGAAPATSLGLGYHFVRGNWQFQALGSYTHDGAFSSANEMVSARYRFIEVGIGGQQVDGTSFFPKAQLAIVTKRFKVSYLYLNRSSVFKNMVGAPSWYEHEISLLVGLHKKGGKSVFSLL